MSHPTNSPTTDPRNSHFLTAAALGLLAGCAVTLIGVAGGLSPEVILLRAGIAGSLAFGLTAGLAVYWKFVSPRQEEE